MHGRCWQGTCREENRLTEQGGASVMAAFFDVKFFWGRADVLNPPEAVRDYLRKPCRAITITAAESARLTKSRTIQTVFINRLTF